MHRTRAMKQLLRTVAVLISLVAPTFANTAPIERNGNEVNLDDCNTNNLTLQFPYLNEINEHFIIFPTLRCLTIKNSQIEKVDDGAFAKMPNLWYLNLQGNRIPAKNLFSFGNLLSVRKLILSDQTSLYWYRCSHSIATVQGIYPELRYLDLKNTGISNIQAAGENPFPELTHLDLSTNKIENFNFTRPWGEKLTDLYFSDNTISQISLELPNLSSLVLNNNNITTIGDNGLDLVNLPKLKDLSLANNRIDSICEEAFNHTVKLRYLNISMNLLSTLHSEMFKDLDSLQVLVLDQNYFEDVPIAARLNLTNLSMNCNRIKVLTNTSLHNLPQLKTLSLTGNMIKRVAKDAFLNQQMLEKLYLNNNKLSDLPNGWCHPMNNLRYLDLSGNKFATFESMIHCSVRSLQHIHVNHNPLALINASTFETLPKHVTVSLDTHNQSNRTTVKCQARPPYQPTTIARCIKIKTTSTEAVPYNGSTTTGTPLSKNN